VFADFAIERLGGQPVRITGTADHGANRRTAATENRGNANEALVTDQRALGD
jgi:hypothetical protein